MVPLRPLVSNSFHYGYASKEDDSGRGFPTLGGDSELISIPLVTEFDGSGPMGDMMERPSEPVAPSLVTKHMSLPFER